MAAPTWVTGQVLAAADVDNWFVPLCSVKGSDQSVTNSTAHVNDTGLVVTAQANCTYMFWCFLHYEGGTAGSSDINFQWGIPSGATLAYHMAYQGAGGTQNVGNTNGSSTAIGLATRGAGLECGTTMNGTLITAGTSGAVVLQWAQNTSNSTSTIVRAGSALVLFRIA